MTLRHWVYILLCENGSYYTGYTTDLRRRFGEHIEGSPKCKYTRSFKPLALAQCWEIKSGKALAMKIERYIKKLSRQQKEELILNPKTLKKEFSFRMKKSAL